MDSPRAEAVCQISEFALHNRRDLRPSRLRGAPWSRPCRTPAAAVSPLSRLGGSTPKPDSHARRALDSGLYTAILHSVAPDSQSGEAARRPPAGVCQAFRAGGLVRPSDETKSSGGHRWTREGEHSAREHRVGTGTTAGGPATIGTFAHRARCPAGLLARNS